MSSTERELVRIEDLTESYLDRERPSSVMKRRRRPDIIVLAGHFGSDGDRGNIDGTEPLGTTVEGS